MPSRYPRRIITNRPLGNDIIGGFWNLSEYSRQKRNNNWNIPENLLGNFLPDSNSEDLFLALPLTNYRSDLTGGFYTDVSPLIRTQYGQTPGSAKTATSTGNGSQSSAIASPFAQYTDNLLVNQQTTTANLFYYSLNLSVATALTVECWAYFPTGFAGSTILATNDFGGGGYPAWNVYRNGADGKAKFFTNTGGSQYIGDGVVSLNEWHHLAWCFSGSGTSYEQYVDGVRGYSGAYGANTGQNAFTIGATNWDGIANNAGLRLQDFRIYTTKKYTGASFTLDLNNPNNGGRILA